MVEAELVQVAFDALAEGLEGMALTERQPMADALLADEGSFSEGRGGVMYGNGIISNAGIGAIRSPCAQEYIGGCSCAYRLPPAQPSMVFIDPLERTRERCSTTAQPVWQRAHF